MPIAHALILILGQVLGIAVAAFLFAKGWVTLNMK